MHIEEAMKQYEFLTGRKLKNSTKLIFLFMWAA